MLCMKFLSYVAVFWLSFYLEPATADSIWQDIWGDPAPDSFYAGMWSYHINPNSRHHEHAENDLLMGVYKGYFAGTLINSYDDRMYAAGIQRNWVQKSLGSQFNYYAGYRLGLVYGYGNKIINLGDFTPPVLPFAQLLTSVTWKNVGWEVSYTGIVISTEFYIKFQL